MCIEYLKDLINSPSKVIKKEKNKKELSHIVGLLLIETFIISLALSLVFSSYITSLTSLVSFITGIVSLGSIAIIFMAFVFYVTLKNLGARGKYSHALKALVFALYPISIGLIIAKYKMINDALTSPKLRSVIKKSFFRPDAQTFSLDFMELWAWKPWAASEKYKAPAETPLSKIPAKVAGFSKKEIEYIKKMDKNWDGKVPALPVKLIVDRVLRVIIKNIEKKYNVTITPVDVLNAIKTLSGMYEGHSSGSTGEIWSFSPYFFFYQIPIQRLMLKLPNGAELEDIEINPLQMYVKTQNVILGHILELEARSKVLEREIGVLLGEFGYDKESKKWIDIQKLLTKNYPNIYESEQTEEMSMQRYEELKPNEVKREKFLSKLRRFGWSFALFVAKGPYEHAFLDRFTKFYFTPSGEQLGRLIAYLFSLYGVPV